jgi:2-polyprenyl-3-methyl-5-hydroxy-6-metoxy-1,4-benzoquinol methylase
MNSVAAFPNGKNVYRCVSCGLRSLRPTLDISGLKDFYDRDEYYKEEIADLHDCLTANYDERSAIIRLYKKHLVDIANIKPPPAKLLEIGCARGVFLDLARKAGYEVCGTEMNGYAVKYAQDQFGLKVEKNSIEETVLDKGSFGVIVALDVIEHLSDPRRLLEAARDLLLPGGIFLVGTPNSDSPLYRIAEISAMLTKSRYHYPLFRFYGRGVEHLNIFNLSNLELLARQCGFTAVKNYPYNIPLGNMCDVNIIYRLAIGVFSLYPYEFVNILRKNP